MTTNKSALGDWSTTNASNGTVDGANVAENCAMSGLNDAIRGLAAGAKGALTYVATAGTDTYTATMAPVPDGYATDTAVLINFGNANTSTTPTLNLNSLGAKTITDHDGLAVQAGVLTGRQVLVYDGVNFRVALKIFGIVQRVFASDATYSSTATVIPVDDTIPQSSEGAQIISAAITPKSATNILRVRATINVSSNAAIKATAALFVGGANAIAAASMDIAASGDLKQIALVYEQVAGGTGTLTFSLRAGPTANNLYVNGNAANRLLGGVSLTTLTIEEVTP